MGVKQVWKKQGDEQWVCYEPQPGGGFGLDCPLHFNAPVVTSPSRTWEGSWHTWTCQNVNTQLYVVLRCQGFPPYFLQTDKRTNTISSEPKNTVTKAWSGYATQPQLLRLDAGSADPELQAPVIYWNAIHRDWFGFQNNHFHYRVEVHDLSGNQIKLVADYQQNPGEGSYAWDGLTDFGEPPPTPAQKGLYTYVVRHEHRTYSPPQQPHAQCTPAGLCPNGCDKSDGLQVTVQKFHHFGIDIEDQRLRGAVVYSLSSLAGACSVEIYGPDTGSGDALARLAVLEGLPTTQGTHWTPDYEIPVVLDDEGEIAATYYAVVLATETEAYAFDHNVDRAPKPALPKGSTTFNAITCDLDIGGVEEKDEEAVGGFAPLNDDDDDDPPNNSQDRVDTGPIANEDDLLALALAVQDTNQELQNPQVTLEATAGAGKVKVWMAATKGVQVTLPKTWALAEMPAALWLEGVQTSGALRDVGLKLSVTGQVPGRPDVAISDEVKATVWDLTISRCPEAWMPTYDPNDPPTVQLTATLLPAGVTSTLKLTLYAVSDEPGFCINKGTQGDADKDLKFSDPQAGLTITGAQKDVAETTTEVNSASVLVACYDYGAFGRLMAEATLGGHTKLSRLETEGNPPVPPQRSAKIPLDDNNNDIADCWVHDTGSPGNPDHCGKADDEDVSANNVHNGDGLTRYREYRGVDWNDDDGIDDATERLNTDQKDLFVQGHGFGGDKPFAIGAAFSSAGIVVHEFVGQVGGANQDDTGIDVLVVTLSPSDGPDPSPSKPHIHRSGAPDANGVRQWVWCTKGASGVGGPVAYGAPSVYAPPTNRYFDDRPHVDGGQDKPGDGVANGTLDPATGVDDANDNGVLDPNEDDGPGGNPPPLPPPDDGDGRFDGDYGEVPYAYNRDLSPMDANRNGLVELPLGTAQEYDKPAVVRHTLTHEMGHAVGINGPFDGHCNDADCLMYRFGINWSRDGHFCTDCRALVYIHNSD
jgi:hypothetical protein